jgi:hypothetical protein
VANGTTNHPVTFTSYNDQNVGGNTGSGRPAAGDWTGLRVGSGATVVGVAMNDDYASTGLDNQGGTVDVSGILDRDSTAINDQTGNVAFRGLVANTNAAVTACNWGAVGAAACTVDATYTQWGTSAGPFGVASGGGDLVCGAVLVSPWTGETGTTQSAFGSKNCDGTSTPDVVADTAGQAFDDLVNADPDNAAVTVATNCLLGVEQNAAAGYPPSVDDTQTTGVAAANEFVDKSSDYLATNASQTVSDNSAVNSFADTINTIATTISGLGPAITGCDPS